MATYPTTLKQLVEGGMPKRLSGIVSDEGGSGALWVRNMFPTEKYDFTLIHICDSAQLATLETFYAANKTTPFDLVYRDTMTTYTNCVFLDAPQKLALVGRKTWKIQVRARQK